MFTKKILATTAASAIILVGAFSGAAMAAPTDVPYAYGTGSSNPSSLGQSGQYTDLGSNPATNLDPGTGATTAAPNTGASGDNSAPSDVPPADPGANGNNDGSNANGNNSNGAKQSVEKGCNGFASNDSTSGQRDNASNNPNFADQWDACQPADPEIFNYFFHFYDVLSTQGLPTGDFLPGDTVELPAISRAGYTFRGWTIGELTCTAPHSAPYSYTFVAGRLDIDTEVIAQACWTAVDDNTGNGNGGGQPDPTPGPKTPKDLYANPSLVKDGASLSGANDYVFSPNSGRNAWVLKADTTTKNPWSLTIAGTDSTGLKLAALNSKSQIIFQSTLSNTTVTGSGFKPNSIAKVFIFSSPVELGTVAIDANGNFIGTLPLPTSMVAGVHHIQVTGFSPTDDYRWATVPVYVAQRATLASSKVQFAGDSSVLTTAGKAILNGLAKKAIAAKFTGLNVYADGFVKPTSASLASDLALAAARAKSVVSYLRSKGVSATYFANAVGRAAPVNSSRKVNITVTAFRVED